MKFHPARKLFTACGAVRLARSAAGQLGEGGVIAFVLSGSVYEPIPGLGISNGLRPGLAGVAKTLATELGPRGIRVLGLLPGKIDTDRLRELDALGGDPAAARERNSAAIPMGRIAETYQMKPLALYLASDASSYVTGSQIMIDGGMSLGKVG